MQTPTLALIVRREEEIKRFVPKDYYMVQADLGKFFVTWQDGKGQTAIFDKAKAEALAEKIKGKEFRVYDVKAADKATPPPMLYDLTELQRDANKQYQDVYKRQLLSRDARDVLARADEHRGVGVGDVVHDGGQDIRQVDKGEMCIRDSPVSRQTAIQGEFTVRSNSKRSLLSQ